MKQHWHEYNPWAADIIYVRLDELAAVCGYSWPAEETLEHWHQYGEELDAYILPQPSGMHSIGVRFGPRGEDYLSPYADQEKLKKLMESLA